MKTWFKLALALLLSLLAVAMTPARAHAHVELAPRFERNLHGDGERALLPGGVHVERAGTTRSRDGVASGPAVVPSYVAPAIAERRARAATSAPSTSFYVRSPRRMRAFLMVFLN